MAFASFILTIIGVSLSSRKVKGGMGLYLGIGLGLSFGYILFQSISSTFAVAGTMSSIEYSPKAMTKTAEFKGAQRVG